MKAVKAARIEAGEEVAVYVVGEAGEARGKIVRNGIDEHGLALFMSDNTVSRFAYIPWSTVTGVYWLGEAKE